MTPKEIREKAEELRLEEIGIPEPTMSNYHSVLEKYRQILNDHSVLIRELARWAATEDERHLPPQTD